MATPLAQKSKEFRTFCVLALLILVVAASGCVRRRFTVRTNPPGAVLYVDNQEIGVTPVATKFTYYGTREIRLEKDGYEPVVQLHQFRTPWYQYPPLDFISENLVPWEIRDQRELDFEMVPLRITPPEELRARAEQLRSNTQAGFSTPLSPPQQPGIPYYGVPTETPTIPLWNSNTPVVTNRNPVESPSSPSDQLQLEPPPVSQPALQPPQGNFQGPQSLPPGGYQLPPLLSSP